MSNKVVLFLFLIDGSSALKIALGDSGRTGSNDGTGSGSGSAQAQVAEETVSIIAASSASIGNPEEITTPKGTLKHAPQAKATFAGAVDADPPVVLRQGGGTVTIKAAAQRELAAKVSPGATIDILLGVGSVGPVPTKPSGCSVYELGLAQTLGGVTTFVNVEGLTEPVCVTLPGCKESATTCATWDHATSTWDDSCATGSPPNCCYTCFSGKSGTGSSSTGASGDPKATNMAGQKFEILAMGTFQLLSISSSSENKKLSLDATIDRAGEMCGATYIKNVSMTGSWIEEFDGLKEVRIRAAPDVPKYKGLQVALGTEEWRSSKDIGKTGMIEQASAEKLVFLVHNVTIEAHIDAHRIRKNAAKTNKFANFLNVNVKGLKDVKEQGVNLGGLLAYDDHSFAMQAPDGCKSGKVANLKQKFESIDSDAQMKFLSSVDVQ